jgi:hypothetical protein
MDKRLALLFAAALFFSACSSPPSKDEQTETAERNAMTPLKQHYPGAVMGFDFHGPVVDVSVDLNGMMDLSDDEDAALKAEAVKRWRAAWEQTHPKQHAVLTVRILDFRGNVNWKRTIRI